MTAKNATPRQLGNIARHKWAMDLAQTERVIRQAQRDLLEVLMDGRFAPSFALMYNIHDLLTPTPDLFDAKAHRHAARTIREAAGYIMREVDDDRHQQIGKIGALLIEFTIDLEKVVARRPR